MSMVLSAEQDELRATLRRFFERTSPPAAIREAVIGDPGHDPQLWKRMAGELGLAGLAVPEEHGGSGFGPVEVAVVCEELGRALVPSPYLASAVLAVQVLLELADPAVNAELLPGIAAGESLATVALAEPGRDAPVAVAAAGGWTLRGRAPRVLGAGCADRVLVVARHDGVTGVFLIDAADPGVVVTPLAGLDTTRRQARLDLDGARGRLVECDDPDAALGRALDLVAVALAAEQLGVLRRCVDLTVSYVSDRVQFGRVVGSFQAVKHGCAEMWVRNELAESAVRHAAACAADDPAALPAAAALALAYTSQAVVDTATDMIQYHGGVAYTWEHDAHLYYRRAHSSAVLLGDPDRHAVRLAELLGIAAI